MRYINLVEYAQIGEVPEVDNTEIDYLKLDKLYVYIVEYKGVKENYSFK